MNWVTIRHYLHYIISLYIVFGGIIAKHGFKSITFVRIHAFVLMGILLHWAMNDGQCFLSQYDYKDDGKQDSYTKEIMKIMNLDKTGLSDMDISRLAVIVPLWYSIYLLSR